MKVRSRLFCILIFLLLFLSYLSAGFLPQANATPTNIKNFDSGDDWPHGLIYSDGFLWASLVVNPARVLKINTTTLDYAQITLPVGYDSALDIEAASGFIWTITQTVPTHLIRINPADFTYQNHLNIAGLSDGESMTFVEGFMWVGGVSKIARVNLTDCAFTLYDYSAVIGSDEIHGLTYGFRSPVGSHPYVYLFGTTTSGKILRIEISNPANYINSSVSQMISDDIYYSESQSSLYFGTESNPRLYKFDVALNLKLNVTSNGPIYGVFGYDENLWVARNTFPGTFGEVGLDLKSLMLTELPDGYNKANELAFDDANNVYVTTWTEPGLLVKYHLYPFTFNGLNDEETGEQDYDGVYATAYFNESMPFNYLFINGSINFHFTAQPQYFRFNMVLDREYWLSPNENNATIYVFNSTLTSYVINFLDLGGVLQDYPFIEAQRYINGVLRTVEKRKIDRENKVGFSLVNGEKYNVVIADGSSYSFGGVLFTSVTSLTLTLRGIDFPKETLLIYKYVRIYGLRAFGTPTGNISITYQDTLNMTTSVAISINYRNGTNAYNTIQTTSQFIVSWLSAENDTDYQIIANINHQRYGSYAWKQFMPRSYSTNPWVLGWLGSIAFNINYIIGILIVIFVGAGFSMINPEVGAFLACCAAAALTLMGWLPPMPGMLIAGFCFALMLGIIAARRRVQTG